jgi:hypothetical protein
VIREAFDGVVRRYDGEAAWYFVTLPLDLADDIRATTEPAGFGSVRVEVRIGTTTWRTSVFPDKGSGSFVLPVKAEVRRREHLDDGTVATVTLTVVDG